MGCFIGVGWWYFWGGSAGDFIISLSFDVCRDFLDVSMAGKLVPTILRLLSILMSALTSLTAWFEEETRDWASCLMIQEISHI